MDKAIWAIGIVVQALGKCMIVGYLDPLGEVLPDFTLPVVSHITPMYPLYNIFPDPLLTPSKSFGCAVCVIAVMAFVIPFRGSR